jgi:propanol-preferring alcohol dehydrogenase
MRAHLLSRPANIETAPLALTTMADPEPGAGQIRLRVHLCGLCRTDLHVVEGDLPPRQLPIIPGHQIVGTVDAVGQGVTRFALGDRVGIAWLRHTCGTCDACLRGDENLCPFSRYTGWTDPGGYAELAVVDEAFAYRLPIEFSDEEAAPLLCAGIIGYRALSRSKVRPGERLGLYGFGSSAHITMQIALARGCKIYVMTRGDEHRALARRLGAHFVGEADAIPPHPLDGAILFAPVGELVLPALEALRPGGTLAIAGIHLSPIPTLNYGRHLFHEKRLVSVEANTRADGEQLLTEAARAHARPSIESFPFEEANRALLLLKQGRFAGTGVLLCQSSSR